MICLWCKNELEGIVVIVDTAIGEAPMHPDCARHFQLVKASVERVTKYMRQRIQNQARAEMN